MYSSKNTNINVLSTKSGTKLAHFLVYESILLPHVFLRFLFVLQIY